MKARCELCEIYKNILNACVSYRHCRNVEQLQYCVDLYSLHCFLLLAFRGLLGSVAMSLQSEISSKGFDFPVQFSQHAKNRADYWKYHKPVLWIVLFKKGWFQWRSNDAIELASQRERGKEKAFFPGAGAALSDWETGVKWWGNFPFHIRHSEHPVALYSSIQS